MDLAQGNRTEVKVVPAGVATALAIYRVVLAATVYRKLRPRFLDSGPAAFTHRASGDTIAILLIVIAVMCLSYFELEDSAGSILVALAIVAVTIIAVTAKLGPMSAAELESQEDPQTERLEQQEERREDREDR